jgi:glycosyltransferase involved in cell wall biosynthesis
MTTHNKKELLSVVLPIYLMNKKDNYEIIISDGYSTDGTQEYLKELHRQGKLDHIILAQERDNGEWEGFKKTLDYVTGDYVYFLTDDDCFNFIAIDAIAAFLENNPSIDYLIANGYDLKSNTLEELNYHGALKSNGSTKTHINKLKDGVCGLGIFVKAKLLTEIELFSPKFGKRTDKTLTLALLNSNYIGASTNTKTYVAIKNEKSNSYLSNYNYSAMQEPEALNQDFSKQFSVDIVTFKEKLNFALSVLQLKTDNEFQIYTN